MVELTMLYGDDGLGIDKTMNNNFGIVLDSSRSYYTNSDKSVVVVANHIDEASDVLLHSKLFDQLNGNCELFKLDFYDGLFDRDVYRLSDMSLVGKLKDLPTPYPMVLAMSNKFVVDLDTK